MPPVLLLGVFATQARICAMTAVMGLSSRLKTAKLMALVPAQEQRKLSTFCDELASAGVSVVLLTAPDAESLKTAKSFSGYDALVGAFGDENLAVDLKCDVVAHQRFPVEKPHEFALRGAACPSEDRLAEAIDSDDVDFLIVTGALACVAQKFAPASDASSKPWFAMTEGDDVDELIESGAKRLALFGPAVEAKQAERIWKKISAAWGPEMQRLLFTQLVQG